MKLRAKRTIRKASLNNDFIGEVRDKKLEEVLEASKILDRSKFYLNDIPQCSTFRPSIEEFKNPLSYMRKIQSKAATTGICKIIPPKGWKESNPDIFFKSKKKFTTKKQYIHKLQQGYGHDDGKDYTCESYKKQAKKILNKFLDTLDCSQLQNTVIDVEKIASSKRKRPTRNCNEYVVPVKELWSTMKDMEKVEFLEKKYWKMVERDVKFIVEYGSDVAVTDLVSGFEGSDSDWNLSRLPMVKDSLFRHLKEKISGVNVPWVYFGMLFSTFCWHYEDDRLFSISYNHCGMPKMWYGVPGSCASKVEEVFKKTVPELFEDEPDLMLKLATMLNPTVLKSHGVPVYKSIHNPGEFMVTFPHAYHSGFNTGFNIAEAVNFALESWLPFGLSCAQLYSKFNRESVIAHERMLMKTVLDYKTLSQSDVPPVIKALGNLIERKKKEINIVEENNMMQKYVEKGESFEVEINSSWRQCTACKINCYLTYATCSLHVKKVSCIGHLESLCQCGEENKVVWHQFSVKELECYLGKLIKQSKCK